MVTNRNFVIASIFGLLLIKSPPAVAQDLRANPETIDVLQELQNNENVAHRSYIAFARQAAS